MARILLACEESQAVCIEFRKRGHEAYSCDILPCSGGHPEWHIHGDVQTMLSAVAWDAIIAFPPCTDLAVSGARYFAQKQADGRQQKSIEFFMQMVNAPAKFVAVENPISIMSTHYRKPDQIIHPYQFGHPERKSTCLWLKNLPCLVQTDNVYEQMLELPRTKQERNKNLPPSPMRQILRSKTYSGIAEAMAEQWSPLIRGSLTAERHALNMEDAGSNPALVTTKGKSGGSSQ